MMKLRNKKTGEIGELINNDKGNFAVLIKKDDWEVGDQTAFYDTLSDFNEEWEDYEEPKGIQCIYYTNHFGQAKIDGVFIGYQTKEKAKLALEKLKAWKRLKDKGFRFKTWGWEDSSDNEYTIYFTLDSKRGDTVDLDLLFGGEE